MPLMITERKELNENANEKGKKKKRDTSIPIFKF
jgi:hypothetical protein